MRQLVYTMRFTGHATPVGPDGNVLVLVAAASGWTMLADVEDVMSTNNTGCPASGAAAFTSELTLTGATSYQEVGTITVGDGSVLRVATVGSGSLARGPGPADRYGAVVWRVAGGTGEFAEVRGLITAHVMLSANLAVNGYHLGMLFVP